MKSQFLDLDLDLPSQQHRNPNPGTVFEGAKQLPELYISNSISHHQCVPLKKYIYQYQLGSGPESAVLLAEWYGVVVLFVYQITHARSAPRAH